MVGEAMFALNPDRPIENTRNAQPTSMHMSNESYNMKIDSCWPFARLPADTEEETRWVSNSFALPFCHVFGPHVAEFVLGAQLQKDVEHLGVMRNGPGGSRTPKLCAMCMHL